MTIELERLVVTGSPRSMGQQQGETWRERVRAFVEMRFEAVQGYMADRGHADWKQIFAVGERSFGLYESWDPAGHAEQVGIAEGAGVDKRRLALGGLDQVGLDGVAKQRHQRTDGFNVVRRNWRAIVCSGDHNPRQPGPKILKF